MTHGSSEGTGAYAAGSAGNAEAASSAARYQPRFRKDTGADVSGQGHRDDEGEREFESLHCLVGLEYENLWLGPKLRGSDDSDDFYIWSIVHVSKAIPYLSPISTMRGLVTQEGGEFLFGSYQSILHWS
jgi:hypothetical protein